ncbi:MAG TPA: ankyrin repeat domain-containing protein [Candidatus Dependentiae bacterium]|nr:ankyrin repeat domain-containing protein [Candidatus Dependentiae bacterium]HRQ62918.1 ankyrin repeat domain-containing protein [Candidatus Dependentiae bacterium]
MHVIIMLSSLFCMLAAPPLYSMERDTRKGTPPRKRPRSYSESTNVETSKPTSNSTHFLIVSPFSSKKRPHSPRKRKNNNGNQQVRFVLPAEVNRQKIEHDAAICMASQQLLEHAHTDNVSLITQLLEQHANPNIQCPITHMTPLHRAAGNGQLEIVRLLVLHKADINAQDKYGNTPLHYAASNGFEDIVRCLLVVNANISLENRKGQNAYAFTAKHHPNTAILTLLNMPKLLKTDQ